MKLLPQTICQIFEMNPLSYCIYKYVYILWSPIKYFLKFIFMLFHEEKFMEFLVGEFPWAWLAQSVERWTFNPTVAGSSPASGLIFFILFTF